MVASFICRLGLRLLIGLRPNAVAGSFGMLRN